MKRGDQLADDINHALKEQYGEPTDIQDKTEHRNETYLGKYRASYEYGEMNVKWEKGDFLITQQIQMYAADTYNDAQVVVMCISSSPQVVTVEYTDVPRFNEANEKADAYKKEKVEREQKERTKKLGL